MIAALLAAPALATRPTEGGLFAFTPEDTVVEWDAPDGRIRVHYSTAGPNVTILADDDADGVPDFAQAAVEISEEALDLYAAQGFELPLSEADLGLGDLGGSPAFDVYLVDYDRNADGSFGVDRCEPTGQTTRCGGYLSVENDFKGYAYPSPRVGLEVVVPHELFHGVQMAYTGDLEGWTAEGTAAWAERLYDPESVDFLGFADAYLEDTERSIDEPPVGPIPLFDYGTCLWWDFLTLRHGTPFMVDLLDAWRADPTDQTADFVQVITSHGDTLEDAWKTFSTWNLATSTHAGAIEGYPYADELEGPATEMTGDLIDDSPRLYPMATTYYRLHHAGGELWFGASNGSPDVVFSIHPTEDGDKDSPVLDAALEFTGEDASVRSLGELPAGQYWIWASQPGNGAESVKLDRLCIGAEADVQGCFASTTTGTTTDGVDEEEPKGCGCDGTGSAGSGLLGLLALVVARRREGVE